MDDAKHAGSDASFRLSVLQNLGGAILLVALVAAMFWTIGVVGRSDDGDPVAADESEESDESEETETEPAEEPGEEPSDAGDAAAAEPEPAETDDADQESDPVEDEEPSDPQAEPDPEPEPPVETMAPADVTVQVLDGYQVDGGAAASGVAGDLEEAGYRIIARNPAIRYEVTTVLWTAGNEEAGRQVAAAIGATEVREQPGTLSDAVAVHVVVGSDRG